MPTISRSHRTLPLSFLLLPLLAGCNGSDVSAVTSPAIGSPPNSWLPPPPAEPVHGHVRGAAAIAQAEFSHYVEGLLTSDGELRLYLGGPIDPRHVLSGAGVPPAALDPAEAMQVVGMLAWSGDVGSGRGLVLGQNCAPLALDRFCNTAAAAEIRMSKIGSSLQGEIRVHTDAGPELWELAVGTWSVYYVNSAARGHRGGIFSERLAPFAGAEGLVINIDDGGRLFFQSASSGCTGNGTLTPHADGRFYVFDVELLIENCNAAYAHFNGAFEGLATETQGGYWDYDSWLVMVLSTPHGMGPRSALAMISSGF
jgi:hypothetical protein